jgi:type IV secretory pathway VirB10-like protein
LLISGLALAGCVTNRPPQISYDVDVPPLPPVPASVTEAPPRPLHTPPAWTPARGGAAAGTPAGRVENANAAARVEPRREGYYNSIQIYPWSEGALYQVDAAPGQITNIALEPGESLTGLGLPGQPGAATAQDRQLAFLNAGVDRRTVSPDRVMAPASPYVLQTGAVIAAALITGIRSDLPGQITAQVTEHVYDSPTGRILLVPQGTRLIGEYSNDVGFGQRRVLLVWKRLILPNGRSIVLERQPGADAQGYAGLQDGVDYHWWDLAKAAGLSTLLSVGAELAVDDQDRLLRAIRNGGQDTINDAGQQIIRRQLNVAPTLTIRPGFPVRVIVTRDLVIEGCDDQAEARPDHRRQAGVGGTRP